MWRIIFQLEIKRVPALSGDWTRDNSAPASLQFPLFVSSLSFLITFHTFFVAQSTIVQCFIYKRKWMENVCYIELLGLRCEKAFISCSSIIIEYSLFYVAFVCYLFYIAWQLKKKLLQNCNTFVLFDKGLKKWKLTKSL